MDGVQQQQPTVFGSMWKYKQLTFLITAALVASAYFLASNQPPAYEATAELVVEDPRASSFFDVGTASRPERYLADQAAIILSPVVAAEAIEIDAELGDLEDVLENREVITTSESSLIQIVYQADSDELAITGADAFAEAYRAVSLESKSSEITAALEEFDLSLTAVDETLDQLQVEIEGAVAREPSAAQLQQQLTEALGRQVELQEQLSLADTELEQTAIRAELADIDGQILRMTNLQTLTLQDPTLSRLFEEQTQAIERKTVLLQSRDELRAEARGENSGIVLFSPAPFAVETGLGMVTAMVLATAVGLALAGFLTYMLANSRRRFETRTGPEDVLGAPMLAEIPRFRSEKIKGELPVVTNPGTVAAEGFRFVATGLPVRPEYVARAPGDPSHLGSEPAEVIAVVSAGAGDGKSVVVANTAIASARQGHRVLALDADFGQQRLSQILAGTNPEAGIAEIMRDDLPLEEAVRRVKVTSGVSLDLLSKGQASFETPDWFGSLRANAFFAEVNRRYDLVLVDTPPLLRVAYATGLVRFSSGVLVVVPHRAKIGPVEDLADRLQLLEADLLGYVYNFAPLREGMYATYAPIAESKREPVKRRASGG